MARPVTLTTTDATAAATYSGVWRPDTFTAPFSASMMLDVTGTANVDLQYTNDDPDAASPLWVSDATIAGKTADAIFAFTIPSRGVRIKQNSGNGSSRVVLVQAG